MDIGERLMHELDQALERLRQRGVVIETAPGTSTEPLSWADPIDQIQRSIERDISFATRSLLLERAQRLAMALDRFRDGRYGICDECEEPIPPARLVAVPEVTTCVRCQDRRERADRLRGRPGESFDVAFDDDDE